MEESYEIDLREYLGVVRRRLWILVAVILAALISSGVLSYLVLPRVYAASTTLMVLKRETPIVDYSTVLLHRQLVKTYGEIAKSRTVAAEVVRELGLPLTVAEFEKKIRVTLVRDTELLEIAVEDRDPALAANMANTLATVFINHVVSLMQVENVVTIDQAVAPTRPVRPRPMLNMAIAGVLGAMTGLGLVFFIEYLDNTLKTAEDVQRYLSLPLLGAIPFIDVRTEGKSPDSALSMQFPASPPGRRSDQSHAQAPGSG